MSNLPQPITVPGITHARKHADCCNECAAMWKVLEAHPGLNDELEQARRDIEEGRGIPFREIRRDDAG